MDEKKYDPTICSKETHFRFTVTNKLKVKRWGKIYDANRNQKGARIALITSDKKKLKIKSFTKDKERHFLLIKGSIHLTALEMSLELERACSEVTN